MHESSAPTSVDVSQPRHGPLDDVCGPTGRSTRPPAIRRTRVKVLTAVITAAVTLAGLMVITWPRTTVMAEFDQPTTVTYTDNRAHHLAVLDRSPLWTGGATLLGARHHRVLYAGSDPSNSYGHFSDVSVPDGSLDGARVQWTSQGARLLLGTGQELFLPARTFVGGR